MTMQQLMGMMQGLQEAMAASKAEQERMQVDLAASQARNDEPPPHEGDISSGVLSQKAPPLFSQFHSSGDDESPHPESTAEVGCSQEDGSLGSGAVRV